MSTKLWSDIEADNLLHDATTIWCIVGYDNTNYHIYHVRDSNKYKYPTNSIIYYDIMEYRDLLYTYSTLAGHNIISYDLPLVKKLHGFNYKFDPAKIVDTHILSRLYYPDREGHGLAYWGNRFRFKKGDHSDFTQFSQEMLDYCIRDVDITRRVDMALADEAGDWDWTEAIKLEYNVWDVQMRQEERGVCFDAAKAEELLTKIVGEIEQIEGTVLAAIPPRLKDDGELKKIFLKDGRYTKPVEEWLGL